MQRNVMTTQYDNDAAWKYQVRLDLSTARMSPRDGYRSHRHEKYDQDTSEEHPAERHPIQDQ